MKVVKYAAIGLSLVAGVAHAQSPVTGNMGFSVTVANSCSILSIVNTVWPNIDGTFAADADSSSGSVSVSCTLGAPYSIGLNNGLNFNGTSRAMNDGLGDLIAYNVYQDAAFSIVWGDIGSGNELVGTGSGASQTDTVYAVIPAGQAPVPAGAYSDTVLVTLNF